MTSQQYTEAEAKFWAAHRRLVVSANKGDRAAAQQSLAIERYMAWFRVEQSAGNGK